MLIFSLKTRAFAELSVNDFGTDQQRMIFKEWAARNPQVRRGPEDPIDDGTGPPPDDLKEVLVDCTHKWFNFMKRRMLRPGITDDELSEIANDSGVLLVIAKSLLGEYPVW